jgi:hypothetical protein
MAPSMATGSFKPLKTEKHHWWPQSLSEFWVGDQGCVHQMSPDGAAVPAPPGNFGAITNAHHVKLSHTSTPWDFNFEPLFNAADSRFPALVKSLLGLRATAAAKEGQFADRLVPLETGSIHDVVDCLLSLVVRSPSFRHSAGGSKPTIKAAKDQTMARAIAGMNLRGCFENFSKEIGGRGKIAILYSDAREFHFGDGFFHNFASTSVVPSNPKCLVPLAPSIAVLFANPQEFLSYPTLLTMLLRPEEVKELNDVVQVYSCDSIFFRSERPQVTEAFSARAFMQYENHKHSWIDQLIHAMAWTSFQRLKN